MDIIWNHTMLFMLEVQQSQMFDKNQTSSSIIQQLVDKQKQPVVSTLMLVILDCKVGFVQLTALRGQLHDKFQPG